MLAISSDPLHSPKIISIAQRIPFEILSTIFKQLIDTTEVAFTIHGILKPNFQFHSQLLLPLTQVCASWAGPGNEILYEIICIERIGQLESLVRYSSRCLELVRHLRIVWNRQPWIVPDPDLTFLPQLITLATNLNYITLGGEQFDLRSEKLLKSIQLSTKLRGISCCSLESSFLDQRFGPQDRRTGGTMKAILAGTSLEACRFDEFRSSYQDQVRVGNGVEDENVDRNGKMRKLVLKKVVLESEKLESLLHSTNLEALYLDRTSLSSYSSWKRIISNLGPILRILHLVECDLWATWESPQSATLIDHLLHFCPNLLDLTLIGSLDLRAPTFEEPHQCLEKLSVGNRYLEAAVLALAILERKFPELKELIIEASCSWTESGYRGVEEACLTQEITYSKFEVVLN